MRVEHGAGSSGLGSWGDHVIHPASVNSSTARLRVATIAGDRLEVRFRYESWVRMASGRPRPRVDLTGLASMLDELEPGGAKWSFNGANATHPVLRTVRGEPSGISPDRFVEHVVEHLGSLDAGTARLGPLCGGPVKRRSDVWGFRQQEAPRGGTTVTGRVRSAGQSRWCFAV